MIRTKVRLGFRPKRASPLSALLTRTYVIPGHAPIITAPPKARVVLNDMIEEDCGGIGGLTAVG
jgi:hypothetical protein